MQKYATVGAMLADAGRSTARRIDGGALLEERAHHLATVLGTGARRHHLARARVRRRDVELDRFVVRPLAVALRRRAAAARRPRERAGLLLQTLARDYPVDQPPRERGRRVDRVAGEHELERALPSDGTGDGDHRRRAEPPALAAGRREGSLAAATARSHEATSWQPAAVATPCTWA